MTSEDQGYKCSYNTKKLYEYLLNNRVGLLSYQERGIKISEEKPGIVYENMAKVLYGKENRKTAETIGRYADEPIFMMQI